MNRSDADDNGNCYGCRHPVGEHFVSERWSGKMYGYCQATGCECIIRLGNQRVPEEWYGARFDDVP